MTTFDREPYNALRVWAEMFNDAQQHRIRTENRIRSASVFTDVFAEEVTAAKATEHRLRLALRRQYRKTAPAGVIAWQKASPGIGDDTLAAILGHLGHPRIAFPQHWEGTGEDRKLIEDEPFLRTVSQLWAYCGHGDPNRKKFKGMTAEDAFALGNPMLKKLVYLMSANAIKQGGRSIETILDLSHAPTAAHSAGAEVDLLGSDQLCFGPQCHAVGADSSPTSTQSSADAQSEVGAGGDPSVSDQPCRVAQTGSVADRPSDTDTPTSGVTEPIAGPSVWPYRLVYEERRLATVGRLHATPCAQCGHQPEGSPWRKGHAQADALRVVGKRILRDIWLASGDSDS